MKRSLFLNTPKDAWLVLQTIVLIMLPFITLSLDFVWWAVLLPIHVFILLNVSNTSMHHHTHWGTFSNRRWDEVYELFVSAACCFSSQMYRKCHTIHHKHVNDIPVNGVTRDPLSVFLDGTNGNRENVWKFCAARTIAAMLLPYKNILSMFGIGKMIPMKFMKYQSWRNEQWASIVLPVLVLVCDPTYGIWMICVIYLLAFFLNYSWHYGEHYGAHHLRGDTTKDSVGIYSRWYNTICFKSGYHQEHHHRPGIHWSRLDEVTPLLAVDRVQVSGMHVTNNPWWQDFKQLFVKLSSN